MPAETEPEALDAWLRRMEESGMIETMQGEPVDLPLPIHLEPPGLAQQWLQEDRTEDRLRT